MEQRELNCKENFAPRIIYLKLPIQGEQCVKDNIFKAANSRSELLPKSKPLLLTAPQLISATNWLPQLCQGVPGRSGVFPSRSCPARNQPRPDVEPSPKSYPSPSRRTRPVFEPSRHPSSSTLQARRSPRPKYILS